MAERIIRVCDLCDAENAAVFQIEADGVKAKVDLCSKCGKPLRDALEAAKKVGGTPVPTVVDRASTTPSRPRGGRGIKVTSMDDVKSQIRDPFRAP